MSDAVYRLLLDVFKAQGLKNPDTAARRAADDFDQAKRNERIYEARGTMTEREVAERFGVSNQRVRQIVREQLLLKRSAA